jgi:type I restriction enzyme S subunit
MKPSVNGWPTVCLSEVADIASGVAKGRRLEGEIVTVPYLRVANVQAGRLDLSEIKQIVVLASEVEKYRLLPGDILMTEGGDRDKLGRGTVWQGQIDPCIHQNHVFRVRAAADRLLPEFLNYYMQTPPARTYFLRCAKQTTGIASVNRTQLSGLPVPLPGLPEQKRIAAILDKADGIRRKRWETRLLADNLIPSVYHEMFGDPVSNPMQWETVRLGDKVAITSGGTPSKAREDYWTGSTPWVSPKDMKASYIFDAQDHISPLALDETTLKVIPTNSILIVVWGMIMAHTIPIAKNEVEVTINQDMKAITPRKGLHPDYLLWTLKAAHHLLLSKVSNAGHGTKRLEVSAFTDFPLPLPADSLQAAFASQASQARKLLAKQAVAEQECEACFDSLVQRAFRGEL